MEKGKKKMQKVIKQREVKLRRTCQWDVKKNNQTDEEKDRKKTLKREAEK